MKLKKFAGILAVFGGLCFCSVYANAAELTVSSCNASKGETVSINVSIKPSGEEAESINGYAVELTYDGDILTPVLQGSDETGGNLYAVSGIESGVFAADFQENSTENKLIIAWADSEKLEISEETLLFTVQFTTADDAEADSTDIELNVIAYANDAETLADNDSIKILSGTVTFTVSLKGDANGDGTVDTIDASLVASYIVGASDIAEEYLTNADANSDSSIDAIDASLIASYIVGSSSIN